MAQPSVTGERKQVTVAFIDIVNFSETASVADPEDLQSWLEGYYRNARAIVEDNQGEVTEYLGDGVVAVFGLSHSDELAATKAVNAALCVVEEFNLNSNSGMQMQLRAGVATGEVAIRTALDKEAWPRLTGMVTTLAQRVQTKAAPGTVMIAEQTRNLLRGKFSFSAHPDQELKGIANKQTLYQASKGTSAPVIPIDDILVGRQAERSAINASHQPMLIAGEAGMGKTALTMHFANQMAAPIICQADANQSNSSYQPFKDWISHLLLDQIDFEAITLAFPKLAENEHLCLALIMGVPEGQKLLTELPGAALKGQIEASLWHALSHDPATDLILFEDLHWYDAASFGVLQHILNAPHKSGIKILMTSRDDPKLRTYLSQPAPQTIHLGQLKKSDALQMLDKLSKGKIDTKFQQELVERAGGVPLFLDHLCRRFSENKTEIPATLMDLLAERIDATGDAKITLQRASAIGQVFRYDLLAALIPDQTQLDQALDKGTKAGVLQKRSDQEWAFAHNLLQQAAYNSLLRKTREELHAGIADVLQSHHTLLWASNPALLAEHQTRARQYIAAIGNYLQANHLALMQGAFSDAESHARTAIDLCEKATGSADDISSLAIAGQNALGSVLMQVQGFTAEPVREAFDAVLRIASSQRIPGAGSAPALFGSFSHAILAADKLRADRFQELLGHIAATVPCEGEHAPVHLASLAVRNCNSFYHADFFDQFKRTREIRDLYRIENHATMIASYGMDIFAAAQMFEAPARVMVGQLDRVDDLVKETDAHQDALNIPVMRPYALIWGAVPLYYAGQKENALERLGKGMEIATSQSAAFWQMTGRAWQFVMDPGLAQTPQGLEEFAQVIETHRLIGANAGEPYFASVYARRLVQVGRVEDAYRISFRAVATARDSNVQYWYADILRAHAAICRAHGQWAEADVSLKLAVHTADRQGAAIWALRSHLDRAALGDDVVSDLQSVLKKFPETAQLPELETARSMLCAL
ncbi:Adenylate cyclase 1 [Roseovarius albus]|uniref:Adenylate cyclase 1 n=1 Tax=Roseovarius albus TaxID=1247867 RepID=A0A1X6ZXI7_9RHOB|nr:adenylate/guanylate cyclase domain-containing protein [Roseovarius albus]SLN64397.1 Adenylate cyclase 1 [Roseovarius albus]